MSVSVVDSTIVSRASERPISRRTFLQSAGAVTAALAAQPAGQPAIGSRPNILFILADDLGYGDLSCYGRPDYQTPMLDNLARQGVRLTSAYAAAPVCTPTRCAFITGRYPQRLDVGLHEPLTARDLDKGLQPEHPTVASLLKGNGYETALIGKWHLGWKPEFGPNRHGFEEFYGILSGAADYFTHQSADSSGSDLWENLARVKHTGYLTDLLSDRAVQFLSRPRTRPFYLSLHYTAPHSPWEGPEHAAIAHTTHGQGPMVAGGSLKIYASMMKSMDAGIGRVLQALRRARLERNTLVIFTSDNGGERYSFNWPFSSQKLDLWEGGIRVPAIVRWPGVIPAGRITEQPAVTMDWTATILAATGTQPDPSYPLDGEDVMPVCRGVRPLYERTLFWRTQRQAAARVGHWKYLEESGHEHLFDLSIDPGEKNDLRTMHADVFERIKGQYVRWNSSMLARI
jgi:arylsulfatase A-like enzyme